MRTESWDHRTPPKRAKSRRVVSCLEKWSLREKFGAKKKRKEKGTRPSLLSAESGVEHEIDAEEEDAGPTRPTWNGALIAFPQPIAVSLHATPSPFAWRKLSRAVPRGPRLNNGQLSANSKSVSLQRCHILHSYPVVEEQFHRWG